MPVALSLLAVVAIATAAWGIISRKQDHAQLQQIVADNSVMVVDVVNPSTTPAAAELVLPGDVEPFTDAPIYARTTGYLRKWYVDIGQSVKAGQVLADIDTPEIDAQKRQAQADVASAQANERLSATTATRYQSLRASGLVADLDVEKAVDDERAKTAQLESARQNLRHIEELDAFRHVTAPFDGIVTARRTDIGSLVTSGSASGQELFHLTTNHRVRIFVQVPQADAPMIHVGLTGKVTRSEGGGGSFPATVVRTAGSLDANTRTLLTEMEADNANGAILPGSFVQVHLPTGASGSGVLRVPANTLLFRGDGLHLAVVDDSNHARLHTVQISHDLGKELELAGGVTPQDRVIVNPADSLMDGQPVRIRATAAASATATAKG